MRHTDSRYTGMRVQITGNICKNQLATKCERIFLVTILGKTGHIITLYGGR